MSHGKNAGVLRSGECVSVDRSLFFPGIKLMFCSHVNAPRNSTVLLFRILINRCVWFIFKVNVPGCETVVNRDTHEDLNELTYLPH